MKSLSSLQFRTHSSSQERNRSPASLVSPITSLLARHQRSSYRLLLSARAKARSPCKFAKPASLDSLSLQEVQAETPSPSLPLLHEVPRKTTPSL
ncbi:hypothetical protein KFK09_028324 [Dendrobium nobile]|uniref:Uncharacterized protein n=1 Tax=Dendrobium nobile TaxID=94219 RepID=A0A8T3A2T6_DENNO|nr:hypothetical protein KFK09_028324 [Dendrobium nobile]